MTTTDTIHFLSLEALQTTHSDLLKRHREQQPDNQDLMDEIETFIEQGRTIGVVLDNNNDRWIV